MDDQPQLQALRQSPLLFPAFFGLVFVGTILVLSFVVPRPTPFQFEVFRTVLALAGAGLISTLTDVFEIQVPILRSGFVKGGAAILVFGVLFFFSPASVISDQARMRVETLRAEYNDPASPVNRASSAIQTLWEGADAQALFEAQARDPMNLDIRTRLARFASEPLSTNSALLSNYRTVVDFYRRIVDCASDGTCDQQAACGAFVEDIEQFRQLYCGVILDYDHRNGDDLWQRLETFAIAKCWPEFINVYIPREKHDFFAKRVCIPTECWSTNLDRAPACLAEHQFAPGIVVPSTLP